MPLSLAALPTSCALSCPCFRFLWSSLQAGHACVFSAFHRCVGKVSKPATFLSSCRECILGVIATNPKCPLCRRAITAPDLRQGVTAAEADAEEAEAEAAAAAAKGGEGEAGAGEAPPAEQAFVSESKLQALLKEVRAASWREGQCRQECKPHRSAVQTGSPSRCWGADESGGRRGEVAHLYATLAHPALFADAAAQDAAHRPHRQGPHLLAVCVDHR